MSFPRYFATILYKLQASQEWYQTSKLKGNQFYAIKNVHRRGRAKVRFFNFWLSWGISAIIFRSFGAQLRKATHVALLATLVGTPSCYPAALPSLVCFCLAFAKIVSEYWWITYTYLVRHYIRMYLYTYVLTYTHLYIKIYTDMHTRISLNMYTYIFIASLRFLLCLLREKSLPVGGECFAPHLTFACQKWVLQVLEIATHGDKR